jgi:hypothetical protein
VVTSFDNGSAFEPQDLRPERISPAPEPVSWPSVNTIPSTSYEAYCLGLDAGRRREDVYFTVFAAMQRWRPAVGPFVASELLSQSITGWVAGSAEWFDAVDTKGGDL